MRPFLLLLLPCAAQLASLLHPAQRPVFRVLDPAPGDHQLQPQPPAQPLPPAPLPQRRRTMVDATGRAFSCALPELQGAGSGAGEGAAALAAAAAGAQLVQAVLAALAASLPAPAPAAPACATRREGYWSYEACLQLGGGEGGGSGGVRQWHSSSPTSPPAQVQYLGLHVPSRDALGYTQRGARYLAQHFEGGVGGRSAEVRWVCARSWPGAAAAGSAASGAQGAPALELLSVVEAPALHYTMLMGSRGEAACELLPSPEALLAPLNGTCMEYAAGGWWTYELCLGHAIVQYHSQGSGERSQVTALGLYDWAHGERLVGGGEDVPAQGSGGEEGAAAPPLFFAGKPTAALTQLYARGAPCDVRGGLPRSTLVRFECAGAPLGSSSSSSSGGRGGSSAPLTSTFSLVGVEESPTCFYTFTVSSSLVCEHPSVGPANALALPPPVHDIVCTPV